METIAKLAIGAAVIGGGAWLLMGSANASTPGAAAQGDVAGCADGTADGKAGYPASRPAWSEGDATSSDSKINAAAKASGSPKDFLKAYAAAYDRCWNDTFVAPTPSPGPKPVPVKPPPGAGPGTPAPDRAKAGTAYNAGCAAGARAGYADGYNGASNSPHPTGGSASGNVAAYNAAFKDVYAQAYMVGSFGRGLPNYAPGESDATTQIVKLQVGCSGKFAEWWGVYLESIGSGAKVAGVAGVASASSSKVLTAGYSREVRLMGLMQLRAPGRTNRKGPVVGRVAADGWPASPVEHRIYSPNPSETRR